MKKIHETIIIGAGISGLACARKLHENKKEFLVISENIGGRICTSDDGKVNYGAYFTKGNFHNFNKFATKGKKLTPFAACFHKEYYSYRVWDKKFFLHLSQALRLIPIIFKFRKHYEVFKKKCENISQYQTIKADPFLYGLYKQNAELFLKENHIKEFAEYYLSQYFHFILSPPFQKLNTFFLLQWLLPWIFPTYEFVFQKEKMIKDFKKNIIIDKVIKITKKKEFHEIKTKKRNFYAKNIVVATPLNISKELLHIKETNNPINGHIFHVSGKPHEPYKHCKLNLFPMSESTRGIARQEDGTFIFLTEEEKPKFHKYFSEHKIIKHKPWLPAIFTEGNTFLECNQEKNLYLIGDHSISGLEDAYITGLYAANRIIKG